MKIVERYELHLCDCCGIMVANADDSGCRFYCGDAHADRVATFPGYLGENFTVAVGADEYVDSRARACDGCGDTINRGYPSEGLVFE